MSDIAALGFEISSAPIEKAESSLDKLSAAAKKTETATEKMNREADNASKKMQAMSGSGGTLTATLTKMAGAITAALSVQQIQQYADTWSDLSSRVRLAIGPQEETADVMSRLSDIARMTYSGLEATAEGFVRNSMTLSALGKTTQEQLDFTEALNNALVVSGAKGMVFESAQSAIGKAMAEGTLRGDELNNILNNGGRIAQLLAEDLGVNVTQLRRLAADGKITGDVIYRSLTKNMERLRDEAASMPATIGDAFTLIRNAILQSVGVFDQQNGLSESLAENLVKVADAIRDTDWTPYINGLTLAAKLYAAYLVAVNAYPAAAAAWVIAIRAKTAALAAFGMQAAMTTKTLLSMNTALSVVGAAFAGWQIGTYLREEFEIVEKAGIALMSGLHQAAIAVGGVFKGLGETIKFALTSPLSFVWGRIVSFLELIQSLGASAAKALGFEGLAEIIGQDLGHLRTTTDQEYRATMQGIVDTTKSEMAGVSDIYFEMFDGVGRKTEETGKKITDEVSKGAANGASEVSKKLTNAFNQYVTQLRQQLALTGEITEAEKALFAIQSGKLKGITEQQKTSLLGLANEVDLRKEIAKAVQHQADAMREQRAIERELQLFREQQGMSVSGMGRGNVARQQLEAEMQVRQEYASKRVALEEAQRVESTRLDVDAYNQRLESFKYAESEKIRIMQETHARRMESEQNWQLGVQESLQNYVDMTGNYYQMAADATTSILGGATNSIADSLKGIIDGTQSVSEAFDNMATGMANAVINALVQMAAQWIVYQGVQMLVGKTAQASGATALAANAQATALQAGLAAFASTAAIPIVGPVMAPAAMATALSITTPLAAAVGTTALAGMAHSGIDSIPQTGTWLLEKGERVTTANTSAKLDRTLDDINEGGGNSVVVNQTLNINGDVSEQTVQMIQRSQQQVFQELARDIKSNGPVLQSIRKKL